MDDPASRTSGALPSRRSKPLDETRLDELAEAASAMPEPIAALAVGVEVARAEGDATGVRKRLFELGVGVVRYAASVGLAMLAADLGPRAAPKPLADALRRAARLSDGQWCDLARVIASALRAESPDGAAALRFASEKPLADLVASRNDFIHRGGPGDDALDRALAVIDAADALLGMPLRVVVATDPPSVEARVGTPIRAGVWRKTRGDLPASVEAGRAYVVTGTRWIPVDPWVPFVERRLLSIDSPHAASKPFRSLDPETGEHREHAPLDKAVRALAGDDPNAPREMTAEPTLVGRSAAVAVLRRAAEEAHAGGVRVVLLTGPFGIGRSRLARALVEAATGFGFGRTLDLACSAERRGPLRALHQALSGASGLGRLREATERARQPDEAAGSRGYEARVEAVEEALIEASLEAPIALAIDDAQWADEHTLSLLCMLTERATRRAEGRLVVVVTARDQAKSSAALLRFVGQIEQDVGSGATRIALGPLDRVETAKLVQGVAPIARAIEEALVAGAGGVPFYVVQPLLVWNETGALRWREAAWHPSSDEVLARAAPGVRDLIRARIASTFDPGSESERAAEHVLACVALFGDGLAIDHLTAATESAGTSPAAAEHAAAVLIEAGLLVSKRTGRELGFAQRIVQRAVLEDLGARPFFRRLHRALLDVVAVSPDAAAEAELIAEGYATLGDRPAADLWLARAIRQALAMGAFERALSLSDRLAAEGHSEEARARAALTAASALLRSGRAREAEARLHRLMSNELPGGRLAIEARVLVLAAASLLRSLPASHDPGLVDDADACADAALSIEARLAVARFRRDEQGIALAEEAARLASGADQGDPRYRALSLRFELMVQIAAGDAARLRHAADDARDAARRIGSTWAELDADNSLAVVETNAGEHARARALFDAIAAKAADAGFGTLRREAMLNAATCSLREGDLADAAKRTAALSEAARGAGDAKLVAQAQSVRADALFRSGALDEAAAAIEESVAIATAGRDYTATLALLRRAEIRAARGDQRGALEDAETARAWAETTGNVDHAARAGLFAAIAIARAFGPGAAARLAEAARYAESHRASLRAPTVRLLDHASELSAAGDLA